MFVSVCEAIRERAVVEFSYDGAARIAEPHCHGQSKAGTEMLRAYQTAGSSHSGNPVGWRLYDVAKIVGLRRTGASFAYDRPGYTPNDSAMSYVHCHV